MKGFLLEDLTWTAAEEVLKSSTVMVLPLGAAAKEHGPHLPLKSDWIIAEYLKSTIVKQSDVVVLPTVTYSYYPAFRQYPGTVSLELSTASRLIVEICRSVANFGPRRFYVLNTGISTAYALDTAASELSNQDIILRYNDLSSCLKSLKEQVSEQQGGTHADEIETSLLLYIARDKVDMSKAVREYNEGDGPLTRHQNEPGVYSASGVWGDPTLANPNKGKKIAYALVETILLEIEELRSA